MDQTTSNVLVFLGATIVGPLVVGLIIRRLWFRDEKEKFYVDADPVKPRPGDDKPR
jgi:hypothetical protein